MQPGPPIMHALPSEPPSNLLQAHEEPRDFLRKASEIGVAKVHEPTATSLTAPSPAIIPDFASAATQLPSSNTLAPDAALAQVQTATSGAQKVLIRMSQTQVIESIKNKNS